MSEQGKTGGEREATRIASVRARDNGWWWEAVEEGRLPIQRCKDCGTLRHPPRPMCGECQSLAWDAIDSALAGRIVSFTVLHYPRFPGYPSPVLCAVLRLDEGVNFVANIVDCAPEDLAIGRRVFGRIERIDAKNTLPQFRLADGGGAA